jgi:nucleoside-diphosphate-sugar epimerase
MSGKKNINPKIWLITGGAGFIGAACARALVKQKQKVIVFDNFSAAGQTRFKDIKKDIRIIKGDILNPASLARAVKGADYVLHFAGFATAAASFDNPGAVYAANVLGTYNALAAAFKAGVKKFVFASTAAVYGNGADKKLKETAPADSQSPYAATKLEAEALCLMFAETCGLKTVILRFFNVYGPGQDGGGKYSAAAAKMIYDARVKNGFFIDSDGSQKRDFIFVTDAARAAILAARKGGAGQVYNAACGKSYSIARLGAEIEKLLGAKVRRVFGKKREGDIKNSAADISKLKKLGFTPKVTLKEGLSIMLKNTECPS